MHAMEPFPPPQQVLPQMLTAFRRPSVAATIQAPRCRINRARGIAGGGCVEDEKGMAMWRSRTRVTNVHHALQARRGHWTYHRTSTEQKPLE